MNPNARTRHPSLGREGTAFRDKVSTSLIQSLLIQNIGQWSATTFAASVENANFGGTALAPGGGFGFNPVLLGGSNPGSSLYFAPYAI